MAAVPRGRGHPAYTWQRLGLRLPVVERVGGFPSPTVLVDGVDAMTGAADVPAMASCRLDVPTEAAVVAALDVAGHNSADPATGEHITVTVRSGAAVWAPQTGVVFVGSDTAVAATDSAECCPPQGSTCTVPAADRCCGTMNFFASQANADAWMTEHPAVQGQVLTQQQALRLGADIFGCLLEGQP